MVKESINYCGMIVIHGTLYEFDKINEQLSVHGDKQSFTKLGFLDLGPEFVSGYYDPYSKELMAYERYANVSDGGDNEEYRPFSIPCEILNHELTEERIKYFNDESLKNNQGFYFVDAALNKRLNGELPEIRFDGIAYIADFQNHQISQKENPGAKFELTRMDILTHGDFLYNTRTKIPSRIDPRISSMPEDTIAVRLLYVAKNDVVGFACYMEFPPTSFVTYNAWQQPYLKAEVIPLSETQIPELIRRNQIEQEKFSKKQTEVPEPIRKKGRRL